MKIQISKTEVERNLGASIPIQANHRYPLDEIVRILMEEIMKKKGLRKGK